MQRLGFLCQRRLDIFIPFGFFFFVFRRADDVDLPAGQTGRQPHVLAVLPDRQRQLGIGNHDQRRLLLLIDADLLDARGIQGFGDEDTRVGGPGNDVDFFPRAAHEQPLEPANP